MRNALTRFLCAGILVASGQSLMPADAAAQTQSVNDLGVSYPKAQDQSRDPRFAVYRWSLGNSGLYQINDATGRVLMVFVETNGQVKRLNIGSLPLSVGLLAVNGATLGAQASAPVTATTVTDSKCPCTSTLTHDDGGHDKIILTTDSSGATVDVTVVN